MKHLLLVGNGFVGKVAADLFRDYGWKVTTVSRSGNADEVADVSNPESLRALKERIEIPTHLLHCASAGGGGVDSYRFVYLNGCKNLVEIFSGLPLLFTSSTSVYGQTDGSVVTEESPAEPGRETGDLLREAEQVVLDAGGIVVRLAGVYGNGRSYLLKRFLTGEAVMEEDGNRWMNHTHHQDAASGCYHLLAAGTEVYGKIFNLCDSRPMRQRQVYSYLADHFDRPMPPSGPRNTNLKRGWSDKAVCNGRMLKLGWKPKYPCFLDAVDEVAKSLGVSV
ncbi:Nucleoside-diphosphate-sugar epimerase [Rubritalea squalenifaciens DSM 18772]|uniref:Nucleoside-diphosphate-sugar epimerase n=1 Tax=Rubritalea squalenifaciens DSM 18772 TaxID=1123071 RepID=A0A1M6EEW8_9BACT|nr:NAD-dependent epimerase/dehydratase family protein [Rubritalea squalenifaciens]SHI83860.1 Nucleoside-diphosphate-sugar epimerase [Rubritalea squalenifaciens DSM 18772]